MNIEGVRANLVSQGMKVLFSPLRVRKSYSCTRFIVLPSYVFFPYLENDDFINRSLQRSRDKHSDSSIALLLTCTHFYFPIKVSTWHTLFPRNCGMLLCVRMATIVIALN